MFRQEAGTELVAVERALTIRAAAITEYTNTGDFIPELNKNSAEALPEWFGLNPDDGEDSAEVIDSSDEGEGEEDEDDEDGTPEVRADGQPQLDRATSHRQARRLLLKAAKLKLASWPLHQPAPLAPPTCRTRLLLLWSRPPIYRSFSCFVVFSTNFC